jgi:hypothetical protein
MRSTPEQDNRLRARLAEAVDQLCGGNAEQFGKMIGHANGGHIRQILKGEKEVRPTIIHRVQAVEGMETWFLSVLSPISLMDMQHPPSERALEVARLYDALSTEEARWRIYQALTMEHNPRPSGPKPSAAQPESASVPGTDRPGVLPIRSPRLRR